MLINNNISREHTYEAAGGIGLFHAPILTNQKGLSHGFTARTGGVSEGSFSSLNLTYGKHDPHENVRENFRRFCLGAGLEYENMVIVSYEHGTNVVKVTKADRGRGLDPHKTPLPKCDGLITNEKNVVLVTSHADCGAYFVFDPKKRAIGLAHAGWKGTLGRIGARVIEKMCSEYGCEPKDMLVSTGPCICVDHYEVDEALAKQFADEFKTDECIKPGRPGKAQLDINVAAAVQFLEAGIKKENLNIMDCCTYEHEELLFSHRRDNGVTGDMAAYMELI